MAHCDQDLTETGSGDALAQKAPTFEDIAAQIRRNIEEQKLQVSHLAGCPLCDNFDDVTLEGANMPKTMKANMQANLTLAFRSLEDARMRMGKAMQAHQGGISILDKKA